MVLVVVDAYSKWLKVKVTRYSTSSATIALLEEIFAAYDTSVNTNGQTERHVEMAKDALYAMDITNLSLQ